VDIDPEQAKRAILELSKIMRYVLYEGDKPTIPIGKEVDMLVHYIELMRLRYADSVKITYRFLEEGGSADVPPLVFLTFVENAFKHGISYRENSFIDTGISIRDGKVFFTCENRLFQTTVLEEEGREGIGLDNLQKRLGLLYGKNYTLDISDDGDVYRVRAVLPSYPSILETNKS